MQECQDGNRYTVLTCCRYYLCCVSNVFNRVLNEVFLGRSDEEEKLWVWNYNGTDMFMDLEEDVSYSLYLVSLLRLEYERPSWMSGGYFDAHGTLWKMISSWELPAGPVSSSTS